MTEWETVQRQEQEAPGPALFAYVLLLVSPLFLVTGLVSVVIAYIYRDDASLWLQSHYQLLIRTFWISLPAVLLGGLLAFILIGYVILLVWFVWFLVRCIKGIRFLNMRRAYPNPESWWI